MRLRTPTLRALRGPMIVLALSATLILAFALPRNNAAYDPPSTDVEIESRWDSEVKRVEVQVGDRVEPGDPLLVLIDPKLEEEILRLENELKLAMLGTKEVVVEEGMTGLIGNLPRVVWTTPEAVKPTNVPAAPVDTSAADAAVSRISRELAVIDVQTKELSADADVVEANLAEANLAITLAETDARNAEQGVAPAEKERDKLQRLYDMGAIPKKRLDAAVATLELITADAAAKKAAVSDAQARVAALEKQVSELQARLTKLGSERTELAGSLGEAQAKAAELRKLKDETPLPRPAAQPVKKMVYGTAPESLAPLQVNLVESDDPDQEAKVAELRAKVLALRKKRDALRITAPVGGVVKFVIEPGTAVANLDSLVTLGR